jgi:hypothetical protein
MAATKTRTAKRLPISKRSLYFPVRDPLDMTPFHWIVQQYGRMDVLDFIAIYGSQQAQSPRNPQRVLNICKAAYWRAVLDAMDKPAPVTTRCDEV